MEDHGILTRPTEQSFLGRMPLLKLTLLWVAIVATITGPGYYSGGTQIQGESFMRQAAIESGILWAGLAVGIATCVTAGLFILSRVHVRRLSVGWAVLWLLFSSVGSAIATYSVIELVANSMPRDWHILTGERYLGRVSTCAWMIMIAATLFVILTGIVFLIRYAATTIRDSETSQQD